MYTHEKAVVAPLVFSEPLLVLLFSLQKMKRALQFNSPLITFITHLSKIAPEHSSDLLRGSPKRTTLIGQSRHSVLRLFMWGAITNSTLMHYDLEAAVCLRTFACSESHHGGLAQSSAVPSGHLHFVEADGLQFGKSQLVLGTRNAAGDPLTGRFSGLKHKRIGCCLLVVLLVLWPEWKGKVAVLYLSVLDDILQHGYSSVVTWFPG